MQLTPEQQQIVRHERGHARISAVAGSGKTTAMVARIHHLLRQGIAADTILVLMFNRSARDAFAGKLEATLETEQTAPPAVRTFHSLGLRLVKSFTARGALPAHTLHVEEYHREKLAREAVKATASIHGGDTSWLTQENMENFLIFIDLVKSDTCSAAELFPRLQLDEDLEYYVKAYAVFERMRGAAKIRFFTDLIHEPVMAMIEDNHLAAWVENHVDYILVDEYQDINEVQQQLLRFIAGTRAEVMVVGDVDQCIYEWRGARPEYMVSRFGLDFPGATTYTLSYTFRFGHRLSLAANHLICNNRFRDRKLCLSHETTPDTRLCWWPETDPHPLLAIVKDWQQEGRTLREVAILIRLYAASVPVELILLENNLPYRIVGHESVFNCPEIQALLGYLYLSQGRLQFLKLRKQALSMVVAMLTNPHLWFKQEVLNTLAAEIVNNPMQAGDLLRQQSLHVDSTYLSGRIRELAALWDSLSRLSGSEKTAIVLEGVIADTDLFSFYQRFSSRKVIAENRIRTCRAFLNFARRRNQDISSFLSDVAQFQQREGEGANGLLITSIHRAKGLEWPLVILPGLEDGSVPYRQEEEMEGGEDIEDERRLMYVGMTRAMEKLCLMYPPDSRFEQRKNSGDCRCPSSTEEKRYPCSCFLYEANLQLSRLLGERIGQPEREAAPLQAKHTAIAQKYLAAVKSTLVLRQSAAGHMPEQAKGKKKQWLSGKELQKGMLVFHKSLGLGTVKSVARFQGIVTVEFQKHGLHNLVINLAELQVVAGKRLG